MRHNPLAFLITVMWLNLMMSAPLHAAAKITLVNSNEQCAGFNDPRPADSSGNNYAITLGQQRLNAFQYAANLIAQHLDTAVEIKVDAQMNALGGTPTSATLGQAGPMSVVRDFSGAPYSNTYYPVALAETLYGAELNGGSDIVAEFNSDVDDSYVLGSLTWYYGFDQGGGGKVDYVTVVLHELLHGLGFLSLLSADGAKFYGRNDAFLLNLEGHAYSPADLKSMSNSQRANAIVDHGNLHWIGPQAVANAGGLSGGIDGSKHIFMYAPATYNAGSSVSHFSNLLNPNEGMEPYYSGADHTPGLAVYLLQDIGWSVTSGSGNADLHLALSDSGNTSLGNDNTYTLTVSNNGGSTAVASMLTYMIPHGHAYVSAGSTQGSCYQANRIVNCALGNIASMGTVTVTIKAKMNAAGNHRHAAIVSSATAESTYTDNRIFTTTEVAGNNDLSLSMVPQNAAFALGGTYTYTATIHNNGPSAATNLALQYALPAGLSFSAASPGSCCSVSADTVSCHLAELASNSSIDLSFMVKAVQLGSYTATPYLIQNQTDANTADNSTKLQVNVANQEDDKCFIATAAFGSLLHEKVKWLRYFRDKYLLKYTVGKLFVRNYYRYSPPVARKLRQSEFLRALMRGSLAPLVALSHWLGQADLSASDQAVVRRPAVPRHRPVRDDTPDDK